MKKNFLLILSLLAILPAMALTRSLNVIYNDNSEHGFILSDDLKISFDGTDMIVSDADASTQFKLADIKGFYYTSSTSAISGVNDEIKVSLTTGALNLSGMKPGTEIAVYDSAGRLVRACTPGREYTLDLSTLVKGAYIVKYGKSTIKISVR